MLAYRTYGVVGATAGVLAFGACSDPAELSDLRPDGPPEVLAVVVNSVDHRDGYAGASIENATFCKTSGPNDGPAGKGDPKRPGPVSTIDTSIIQICPDDLTMDVPELTDAMPESWYARIVFDELLDASVEDLVPVLDDTGMPTGTYNGTLANTQPVTLQCESVNGGLVTVDYDGYYSPSGNSVTYPLGPSLVIKPNDPTLIATKSECQVTLKDTIHDKSGNPVPADQRGPYKFKIAPIQVIAIAPADGDSLDPVAAGVDLTFNTAIDFTSINTDPTLPPVTFAFAPAVDNTGIAPEAADELFVYGDFGAEGGPFTFAFTTGAKIKDACGVETTFSAASLADFTKVSFSTNALLLNGISPTAGAAVDPAKKIRLSFNQYMDATTLAAGTDFTVSPAISNMAVVADGSDLLIDGDYQLGTQYLFTLKANAMVDDCPGPEAPCVTSATFTNDMDQSISFTTASAISLSSISPKDNSTVQLGTLGDPTSIVLTFNQQIEPSTLDATDYTITPAVTLAVDTTASPDGTTGHGGGTSYGDLVLGGTLPPGTYTFTLKANAQLKDTLGNTFTNPTDRVVHFTVTSPSPTATCL